MARAGCDVVDVATASMADGTSQPSMNALVAMLEGGDRATAFRFLDLEPYDMYWARVRLLYSDFESGMLSGSARVYEHQIPGERGVVCCAVLYHRVCASCLKHIFVVFVSWCTSFLMSCTCVQVGSTPTCWCSVAPWVCGVAGRR